MEELAGFAEGWDVGARETVGVKDDPRFGAWTAGKGVAPYRVGADSVGAARVEVGPRALHRA